MYCLLSWNFGKCCPGNIPVSPSSSQMYIPSSSVRPPWTGKQQIHVDAVENSVVDCYSNIQKISIFHKRNQFHCLNVKVMWSLRTEWQILIKSDMIGLRTEEMLNSGSVRSSGKTKLSKWTASRWGVEPREGPRNLRNFNVYYIFHFFANLVAI